MTDTNRRKSDNVNLLEQHFGTAITMISVALLSWILYEQNMQGKEQIRNKGELGIQFAELKGVVDLLSSEVVSLRVALKAASKDIYTSKSALFDHDILKKTAKYDNNLLKARISRRDKKFKLLQKRVLALEIKNGIRS